MLPDKVSNFTNCIITCVWADGVNRTPPLLFTYNSAFRLDRNPTKRRTAQQAHLIGLMDKYGISKERIIYVGSERHESRKYVRESPDLIRRFFGVYGVLEGVTIYSDEGNAFFDNGESVLKEHGFKKHVCYPAKVHQYLSPNDNRLHGTSKQSWRNSGIDFSDDIHRCLALLHFLDRDIVKHSRHWWVTNLIEIQEGGVAKHIGQGPCKLSHLHKHWKRSYEQFMNKINKNDE